MTAGYIGQAVANAASVTLPAHQAGDLIWIEAFRNASATAPSLPGGGWATPTNGSGGANTCSQRVGWKIAASSSETSGTWTNANQISARIYRPSASGLLLSIGAVAQGGGTGTTVTYPALTLQDLSGASLLGGMGAHRSINTNVQTGPTGIASNRSNVVGGAAGELAGHDSNTGRTTNYTATGVAVGGTSSGWRAVTFEIRERPAPSPDAWDYTTAAGTLSNSDKTITGDGGGNPTALSTTSHTSGLHFAEIAVGTNTPGSFIGVSTSTGTVARYYSDDGTLFDQTFTPVGTFASYTTGDVIGLGADQTGNTISFYKNGVLQGSPAVTLASALIVYSGTGNTDAATINTGPTFAYTKPSGFDDWYAAAGGAYSLTAAAGSYALTGTAATPKRGRVTTAASGSYSLTGTAATLRKGYAVVGGAGAYSLSGTAANLTRTRRVDAQAGAYALAGQPAGTLVKRLVDAVTGTYAIVGTDATLTKTAALMLSAGAGAYALSGQAASLRSARNVIAGPGAYSLTGQAVGALVTRMLSAQSGQYQIVGSDVDMTLAGGGGEPGNGSDWLIRFRRRRR